MSSKVAEINKADVELVKTEPARRRYGVSLSGERLKSVESRWMDLAKNNARLPGFRKGHAPQDVVIGQMGDWLKGKVMEELLRAVVEDIVRKDALKVVSNAVVDKVDYKIGDKMNFEVIFDVEPEFSVKDYTGVELKRHSRPVKDEEVDKEFKRLAGSQEPAYLVPTDGKSKENLWALIDLKFFSPGNSQEPFWSIESHMTSLGEDQNLPWGLRDAVAAMKPGDSKEIPMDFDEDCPVAELKGKKGRMAVQLWEFKRLEVTPSGTGLGLEESKIQEIRAQIRKALEERFKQRERRLMEDQLVAALLERNPIEVSDSEIENRTKELTERARGVLAMSGVKGGLSAEHENELRVKYRIEAANDVRFSYIAREIAKRENIKITEEDFKKRLESAENDEEKEYLQNNKEGVFYSLMMERVFEFLISKAKIETVEV